MNNPYQSNRGNRTYTQTYSNKHKSSFTQNNRSSNIYSQKRSKIY